MRLDPSLPASRPLLDRTPVRTLLVASAVASAVAALAALAGCETTSSGRPKSTKSSREARDASPKSPAQWTMMREGPTWSGETAIGGMEFDDEEFGQEEMTVEIEVAEGAGPDGSDVIIERRVIRRAATHGGPAMGPGPGSAPGQGTGPGWGPGPAHAQGGPDGGDGPKPVHPPVMLGVRMRELDPVLATHLGLDARKCAVLEDVAEELGGHAGGLRDHDIIIAVDGSGDASPSHIRRVLRSKKPGDTIDFTVRRADGKQDVKITLEGFDHGKLLSVTPARVGG